ncbi:MAG: hypothetical protein RIS92_2319 [Verrucomicrobiota bacterium]
MSEGRNRDEEQCRRRDARTNADGAVERRDGKRHGRNVPSRRGKGEVGSENLWEGMRGFFVTRRREDTKGGGEGGIMGLSGSVVSWMTRE